MTVTTTTLKRPLLALFVAGLLGALLLIVLHACNDDPAPSPENCSNGADDDLDGFIDCDDVNCARDPFCAPTDGDGDSDGDGDGDSDGDGDGDGDSDADSDADTDADGDGDADGDADTDADQDSEPTRPCTEEGEVCEWFCGSASDCAIGLDLVECCGGFPHEVDGEMVVCPSAMPRQRFEEDPCAIPWSPGDPLPEVPAACDPYCEGVVCGACRDIEDVACAGDQCVGMVAGGCVDDRDCPRGQECVDPDGDGMRTCREGTHECTVDDECRARFPRCDDCLCGDADVDGIRDCQCWGCPTGTCFVDSICEPHEFCILNTCTFAGSDACRIGMWDCAAGEECVASDGNPSRGTCEPIAEEDAGADADAS